MTLSHPCYGLCGDPPGAPAVTSDAELLMLSCHCQLGCATKFLFPEIKPMGEFCFWPPCAGIPLPFHVWGVSGCLHWVHSAGTAAMLWSRDVCVGAGGCKLCFCLAMCKMGTNWPN